MVSYLSREAVEDAGAIVGEGVVNQGADFVCCALGGLHEAQASSPWVGVNL